MAERTMVSLEGLEIEAFAGGPGFEPMVCAAHPADRFDAATVELLAGIAGVRVTCVNPWRLDEGPRTSITPFPPSLADMVDRIEEVRRRLGFDRWIFWGMSGGGWLAQIYAHRYPESLAGIVVESACLCFRERLSDPECVLSPFFPAWQGPLEAAGLLPDSSPAEAVSGDDAAWVHVDGVGQVFRQRGGPALLVSPGPLAPEMESIMPRLWEFDSRAWIGSIRTPALVLCGTADPVVPVRHSRTVHQSIHGSSFVEIVGAGHVPTAQGRPEVTAAFQAFVSTLRSAT